MEIKDFFKKRRIYHLYLFLYDYQSYEYIGEIIKSLKLSEIDNEAKSFIEMILLNSLEQEIILIKDGDKIYSKKENNIPELISEIMINWNKFDDSINNTGFHYKYSIHYTEKWIKELKSLSLYP